MQTVNVPFTKEDFNLVGTALEKLKVQLLTSKSTQVAESVRDQLVEQIVMLEQKLASNEISWDSLFLTTTSTAG